MGQKKRWSDLTPGQQKAIVIGGVLEVAATAWALRDLSRRSREQVRGPKALWVAGMVVQPVGPIAYAVLGRR